MNYDLHIVPRDPVDAFIASLGPSSRGDALAIQRRYKQLTSDFTRALQETNDRELARYCTDVSSQIHRALSEWRGLVRLATKHAERMPAGKPKGVVEVPGEGGGPFRRPCECGEDTFTTEAEASGEPRWRCMVCKALAPRAEGLVVP